MDGKTSGSKLAEVASIIVVLSALAAAILWLCTMAGRGSSDEQRLTNLEHQLDRLTDRVDYEFGPDSKKGK